MSSLDKAEYPYKEIGFGSIRTNPVFMEIAYTDYRGVLTILRAVHEFGGLISYWDGDRQTTHDTFMATYLRAVETQRKAEFGSQKAQYNQQVAHTLAREKLDRTLEDYPTEPIEEF